jgi:hypothetical protein
MLLESQADSKTKEVLTENNTAFNSNENESKETVATSSIYTVSLNAAASTSSTSSQTPVMQSLRPACSRVRPQHLEDFDVEISKFKNSLINLRNVLELNLYIMKTP